MTSYAARAVAWGRLAVSLTLVVVLTEMARLWPGPTWGLLAVAVAVLAGAAAWCADEPAAAVVDTAPRGLAWRTAARSPALLLLAGVWTLQLWRGWDQLYARGTEVLVQGLAALLIATGWTAWLRSRGRATPGFRFASAVIPGAMVVAMVAPVSERLWLFPFAIDPAWHWQVSHAGWLTAGLLAALALAASLADAPWWRIRRHA